MEGLRSPAAVCGEADRMPAQGLPRALRPGRKQSSVQPRFGLVTGSAVCAARPHHHTPSRRGMPIQEGIRTGSLPWPVGTSRWNGTAPPPGGLRKRRPGGRRQTDAVPDRQGQRHQPQHDLQARGGSTGTAELAGTQQALPSAGVPAWGSPQLRGRLTASHIAEFNRPAKHLSDSFIALETLTRSSREIAVKRLMTCS